MSARTLRRAYTLLAPLYDLALESVSRKPRRESLARLDPARDRDVLICGAGSGLDLPHLPPCRSVTALDLTPAMLRRARERARRLGRGPSFVIGDATALPFADASFDAMVLHLILAVVPRPDLALAETQRVLRPGGRALVMDKFLRPGERAFVRRFASLFIGPLLTRTDVVFEDALAAAPALRVTEDRPLLLGGWFRLITLAKS
ncbi:MAG TPA: methyltransferase domain-containing protein [bacterium]